MSNPLLATGQCRTELHPLCPGGLCTCRCHQPAEAAQAHLARHQELVDTLHVPGFFQRVVARRLGPLVPEWAGLSDTEPERLTEALAPEVGRIVVDQLLELAETLSEQQDNWWSMAQAVDMARLIDPVHTEQHWDETKEARR